MDFFRAKNQKFRWWLIWVFVSVLFTLLIWIYRTVVMGINLIGAEWAFLLAIGPVLAFLATLLASAVTTFITLRKERRESNGGGIDLEKNKLEIEKLRREINDQNATAQQKRNKMRKGKPGRLRTYRKP
jgi:type VI protein secretion system component VasK